MWNIQCKIIYQNDVIFRLTLSADLFRFYQTMNDENTFEVFSFFRLSAEERPPILRLRLIRLHVIVTSFKRKYDANISYSMYIE